ncbi:Uncharacterized membrane protein YcaP, DUF421 family [Terribacillus aidingensis]|uniref:Uncharacterized membrane protein YcaP, DUF421 family n=1 Tax=Terribacillus aidingensis TaxID=586416 RepID=A0A285N961_9BACI|nr:DUF421 domain-containing protein [Terribacillus aidingensis]SNZ05453.1 Uncharacterized membrane protein YcaP, DUF421 family [Terribacillus aidingensis]
MGIAEVTLRSLIGFAVLFIVARVLGKKLIAQMTFFDFVTGITIGSVTANLILNKQIRLTTGVYALLIFGFLTLALGLLTIKVFSARKVLSGEPLLIIKNGKIYEQGMMHARLSVDSLLHQLRKKNIFYLDDVDFAFFETDGTISPNQKKTQSEQSSGRGLPQTFIIDGRVLEDSLQALNKDKKWLDNLLASHQTKLKDVFVAQLDQNDNLYIDYRQDRQPQ